MLYLHTQHTPYPLAHDPEASPPSWVHSLLKFWNNFKALKWLGKLTQAPSLKVCFKHFTCKRNGTTLRLMLLRGVAGPVAIAGPGANRVWKLHDLEEGDWKIMRIGYETWSKWRYDRTTQLTELFPARATRFFCDFEAVDCRNKTATFRSFRTRMQLELTLPTTTLLKTAAMERMVKNLMALCF